MHFDYGLAVKLGRVKQWSRLVLRVARSLATCSSAAQHRILQLVCACLTCGYQRSHGDCVPEKYGGLGNPLVHLLHPSDAYNRHG